MSGTTGRATWRTAAIALPTLCALLVVGVAALLRAPTRELVVELAPVDLPAGVGHDASHGGSHGAMAEPPVRAVALPAGGWLQGYSVDLVDADGRPVPRAVLHHVNLITPQRRELFSPIMLRLGAAGAETPPVRLPRLLGAPVRQGDTLLVTAMLHNPTGRAYRGVRLRVHLPYVPADSRVRPLAVYPFYVDVMPPAGTHDFDLPPGRSVTYWEGRPAVAGRVLGVGGHLHRYGTLLRFEDRTAGRVLWEARPRTDAAGDVTSVPTGYLLPLGATLDPAHVYRLSVFYDNPTGATIPAGGMGTLGGVVVPARGAEWPAVQRADAEYRKDVRVTWRLDEATMGHAMDMGAQGMHTH